MPPPLVLTGGPTAPRAPSVSARPIVTSATRPARPSAQPTTTVLTLAIKAPEFVPNSQAGDRVTPVEAEERVAQPSTPPPADLCTQQPPETPSEFAHEPYSWAPSVSSASHALYKDQNSVTIKSNTSVKDSAGAIMKVLDRLSSTIVTALKQEPGHEALNRAVKALAVCRKYLTDNHPGMELTFMPVQRSDCWGRLDPNMFSFLAFKSLLHPEASATLENNPESDLHVSSGSDIHTMAAAIMHNVLEHGKVVMKAGGGCALYVAMAAVVQARQMLKAFHAMDIGLVPQWITEDTRAKLGRESKFVQFLVLPAGLHGVMPGDAHAARQPAFTAVCASATAM